MGNLGHSMYDAVNMVLSGEPGVLSRLQGGLSVSSSSGMTGGVSARWCAVGVPSFSGMTLALGRGLRADRCWRMSLMEGDVLPAGVGFKAWGRQGMQHGGFDEEPGSGVWGRHLDRGLGLGIQDMFGWGCRDRKCCSGGYVGMYWPQVFPGSPVPHALGLYVVAAWHGSPPCNNTYKAGAVDIMISQSCILCGSILFIS